MRQVIAGVHKSLVLDIADETAVGAVRRAAAVRAAGLRFDETQRGEVAIVAAEAANNIVRHAGSGEFILRVLENGDRSGLEILALDRGPGIADVSRAIEDGYSTAGTPGTGLGAIGRLSSLTDVHSSRGQGTALLAQFWPRGGTSTSAPSTSFTTGVVCVPISGEEACGDDWTAIARGDGRELFVVADGLGHGIQAAEAAATAIRIARAESHQDPVAIIQCAHAALRSTRGAALAIADVDRRKQVLRFAGVGNIAASILVPGQSRSLVSHNGTVGHEMRRAGEFSYAFPEGAVLVMATDGISTHARLDAYPGLLSRHPALIAGVLYRDFSRRRDDATVLVAHPRAVSAA